jgi:hypothetical protein
MPKQQVDDSYRDAMAFALAIQRGDKEAAEAILDNCTPLIAASLAHMLITMLADLGLDPGVALACYQRAHLEAEQ